MELQQINMFITLAACENTSAAAEALHTSQPQVSKLLSSLEAELGVQLFDRIGRGIKLNEQGRLFLRYAQGSMRMLQDGQLLMKSVSGGQSGTINIGSYTFSDLLTPCIADYARQNPRVNFTFSAPSPQNPKSLDELDIILISRIHGRYHMSLHFPVNITLAHGEYYMIFSRSLSESLFAKETVTLRDIADYPFIITGKITSDFSSDGILYRNIVRYLGMAPRIAYRVHNLDLKLSMVQRGMGISFIPTACLDVARRQVPDCRICPITELDTACSVIVARRSDEECSALALSFWKHIQAMHASGN